ncbi:putative A/G-specific adenine glycosylase YfhQ [Bacillus sp. THAF10]|uniref:A/G-specific adenine glycosylase n=1 Tax=Bacillus sp. THAF10 TaxID=2587848 RepID=UPI0012679958|nr:A/G-specific adenine glycosylase [Bacillus sp. THAF10]QFT88044.1 putative A/G-specific adenine glycosylase YfhQ [Bacillus sp. THAF10]
MTQHERLKNFHINEFQHDLIAWFEKEQRDLPWRKDKDPYKVWVSEIMLQQTKVDTVIPYFNSFIEQFPNIQSLAEAEEEKVLKAWEGLGYYSRVRNLQSAVKEVHESYQGKVPNNAKEISALKGVGPYTTGAILSIAYGVPEPAVDGNVMRVLSRILLIEEDIAKVKTRKLFEEVIRELISKENPSFFNQGLMELGALVCTPTSPSCLLCPVREHCRAFHQGKQRELPVKTKKKSTKQVALVAAILKDEQGRYLIHKRASDGLLANLWEFPNFVKIDELGTPKQQLQALVSSEYGINILLGDFLCDINHVFSHLVWNVGVYDGTWTGEIPKESQLKAVTEEEMKQYAFPVSHLNMWKEYKNQQEAAPKL